MARADFSAFQQKRFGDEGGGRKRPENRGGAPENPNIGKPFKRYIGGDEVQKRAQNFSMFSRPPVVAPPPAQRPAPVPPGGGAPMPSGPGGVLPQMPPQNPGINPNQMYSDPSQVQSIPAPVAPVAGGIGGGGMFGQMPQATGMAGQRTLNPAMPQVPQRPIQYSLANRGWGPNSR